MSLAHAYSEMMAPTVVNMNICGNLQPSTREGACQGHQCLVAPPVKHQGMSADFGQGCANDIGEVREVMGRYAMCMTKDNLLGEGSFSICRRGTDLVTGEAVAIKMYKVQQGGVDCTFDEMHAKFVRQVSVLQKLQDRQNCVAVPKPEKFFVQLLDYSRDETGSPGPDPCDGTMYVVTELAEQSLKDYLCTQRARGQTLSREAVRRLARSVVAAAAALHAKGYVHLDLKPENIMIFNGRLKIIDVEGCVKIGSSVSLQDTSCSFSPCYCAPEWARFLQAGPQSEIVVRPGLDAWSVGLILCECVTLSAVMRPAFSHFLKCAGSTSEAHSAFVCWLASLETAPVPECVEKFDVELGEFLSQGLLECNPDLRLTPAECLSSQYLAAA